VAELDEPFQDGLDESRGSADVAGGPDGGGQGVLDQLRRCDATGGRVAPGGASRV
jgi:hypothetical protein